MSMKAMVLNATGPVEADPLAASTVELRRPGPKLIRIMVAVCGVCHTDLHTVAVELPARPLPIIPGHQARAGTCMPPSKNVAFQPR